MFKEPSNIVVTVYSKKDCVYCYKVKDLLHKKNIEFEEINCDTYLEQNRNDFLDFIKNKIGKEYKTFPMIFVNGKFIGGYNETYIYFTDDDEDF